MKVYFKGGFIMKNLKGIIKSLDKKTDSVNKKTKKKFRKFFPLLSMTLLALLVLFFLLRVYKNKPYFVTSVISDDIGMIVDSLNRIDKECSILSIEHERNYVDFLTVAKFVGSEIGCLNLAFPDKWQGPYIEDNPTMRGKLYEIVKTKEGIFVVPGLGVKLPNGLRVGKDFEITFDSSIKEMLQDGGSLNYKGQALATELKFEIGDWGKEEVIIKRIESFNDAIKEFNEAMPFTKNDDSEENSSCG